MKTLTINLYEFNELPAEIQAKVLNDNRDINVSHDWWDCTLEDAKNIGLKITSFDLDRNRHAKGEFIGTAYETACKIKSDHGESCETCKTAIDFISEYDGAEVLWPVIEDEDGQDTNEDNRNEYIKELEEEFLKSLLEDYSIMLQRECEYLQSDEAVKDSLIANEYTFEESGKMRNI